MGLYSSSLSANNLTNESSYASNSEDIILDIMLLSPTSEATLVSLLHLLPKSCVQVFDKRFRSFAQMILVTKFILHPKDDGLIGLHSEAVMVNRALLVDY